MTDSICMLILAAGQGTRMKVNLPKPLVPIMNRAIIDYVFDTCFEFRGKADLKTKISLVLGHQKEVFIEHLSKVYPSEKFHITTQEKQLGTADAVKSFMRQFPEIGEYEYTLILSGDVPLVSTHHLNTLFTEIKKQKKLALVATFSTETPDGYGRILKSEKGLKIVEEKDADHETKKIKEVNSGLYIYKTSYLKECIEGISNNNKSNEFYLTDTFKQGIEVGALHFDHGTDLLGINNLVQLESTAKRIRNKILEKHAANGVRFWDFSSTFVETKVTIGSGSVIYPGVILEGNTKIGSNCSIGPYSVLKDVDIEDNVQIKGHSTLESCNVRLQAEVGPYARIRPGTDIGKKSKIGNFVEVKKSKLAEGVKISHLSYVGDAIVGDNSNIGCGFITCNYDGLNKHVTKIGKNCFIGSDSQAVAPVEIGDDCFVASGSTINSSMPDGSFAISRGRQITKNDMAKRFLKSKKEK